MARIERVGSQADEELADSLSRVDLCARLLDVDPAGRATWVSDGILRVDIPTRMLDHLSAAIDLGACCYRFARGHRLRLELASSSFPQFDRADLGQGSWRTSIIFDAATPNALTVPTKRDTAERAAPPSEAPLPDSDAPSEVI